MVPFLLKTTSITLFPSNAAPLVVNHDHMNFAAVRQALLAGDYDTAVELGSVASFITKASAGNVVVTDTDVLYKGQPINSYLTMRMIQFASEGLDVSHYCRFLDNVMANPSMVSREELYLFLEAANLPITEDGCFLAYKAVGPDFKDKHSRTFDNSPGQVLVMPRRDVDDNRERTCSYGFHVAAYEYAKNFMSPGDKMVVTKNNPADVVSVPSDYKNQKLRICRYEVMFEVPGAADTLTGKSFYQDEPETFPDYDDENEDDYYPDFFRDDYDDSDDDLNRI